MSVFSPASSSLHMHLSVVKGLISSQMNALQNTSVSRNVRQEGMYYSLPMSMANCVNYESRITSFIDKGPKFLQSHTLQELSRAGFVHSGSSDKVK